MADLTEVAITTDVVKKRAELAGISLEQERIEDIAATLEMALAPLRSLDLHAIRLIEPAATFDAEWPG